MSKNVVNYLRVSSEKQAADDKISIGEQLAMCEQLAQRNGWTVVETFTDKERYKKTKTPSKGKKVQPSGRYDDRPGFLAMLDLVESGSVDAIVSFDISRVGRHFRVLGTLANTMANANNQRNGRGEVELWEASKNTSLNQVMLGIMISIAQQENEDRIRRVKMGRRGTLKQGRWPGSYNRFGYSTMKEDGLRGVLIIINDDEAEVVRLIFDLSDSGHSIYQIRDILIARGIKQKNLKARNKDRRWDWHPSLIREILHCRDYLGRAVWDFRDETIPLEDRTIEIPRIIEREQFERVQRKIKDRIAKSKRNTKAIAAIQYIAFCGECGAALNTSKRNDYSRKRKDGTTYRRDWKVPKHSYNCRTASQFRLEDHATTSWWGPTLDYSIWKFLVDNVIMNADLLKQRILERQAQLQVQGDEHDSEIAEKERRLVEIDSERRYYLKKAAQGLMDEAESDEEIFKLNAQKDIIQGEIEELRTLRDNARQVQAGIDYTQQFLLDVRIRLPELNISPKEFNRLDGDRQKYILEERKKIIQAVCEKVIITGDHIKIEGIVDTEKMAMAVSDDNLSQSVDVSTPGWDDPKRKRVSGRGQERRRF